MQRARYAALTAALVTLAFLPASAEEPQPTVSLAGLSIGRLVVTAAAGTIDEAALRQTAEARLAKAGIVVDGVSATVLFLNVSAQHILAESSPCACSVHQVMLALREPVTVDRVPGEVVDVITWSARSSVKWASRSAPRATLSDAVQEVLGTFLRAVKSDTQKSQKDR
jgi:hypothetical protein